MDQFAFVLLVMGGIITLLVLSVGWRDNEGSVLRLLSTLAMAWAAVSALGVIAVIALPLIGGQALDITLTPVVEPEQSPAPGVLSLAAESVRATVEPSALSAGAVGLTLAGSGITGIVSAIVAGVIAFALRRIAAGDPFQRSMHRATLLAGVALTSGLLLGAGLSGFARMVVADELNSQLGAERFVLGFELDLTPVLIGVVVLALSSLFRIGERLQRDTAGLV